MKVAILDDYQKVARDFADWSRLPGGVQTTFFHDTLSDREALVARMAPSDSGNRWPMPVQWGTWKNRLRVVSGPIWTDSNNMSKRGSRGIVSLHNSNHAGKLSWCAGDNKLATGMGT